MNKEMAKKRFHFIDIVKGVGIFEFIIWHVLRNFYYYPPSTAVLQRLVFSVTGYFVFSAGFLIGGYYYSKIENGSDWQPILGRLCVRSLKLIFIMLFAGFVIAYLDSSNLLSSFQLSITKAISLFYVDRWDVPLQVLLAISVTLFFGFLIFVSCIKSRGMSVFFLIITISLLIYDFIAIKDFPYLWRYFFQGLMGIYVGSVFYNRVVSGKTSNKVLLIIGIVCFVLFALVELSVSLQQPLYYFFVLNVTAQFFAVVTFFIGSGLLLYLAYDIHGRSISFVAGSFSLLGKHSLFVYLVQIVIIDLLVIVYDGAKFTTQIEGFLYAMSLLILCVLICRLVEFLLRYKRVKFMYDLIFR